MADGAILSLRGLTRDFGPFRAVEDVSLDIRRGSITGLIGPNGAGKTTLFGMVAGALKPTSGQVLLKLRTTGSFQDFALRAQVPQPRADAGVSLARDLMELRLARIWRRT